MNKMTKQGSKKLMLIPLALFASVVLMGSIFANAAALEPNFKKNIKTEPPKALPPIQKALKELKISLNSSPTKPKSGALNISPTTKSGDMLTITVNTSPAYATTIILHYSVDQNNWNELQSLQTSSDGSAKTTLNPKIESKFGKLPITKKLYLRAYFAGDKEYNNATSNILSIELSRSAPALIRLADHPNAQAIMSNLSKESNKWDINVALVGDHKAMVNNCLGLRISAYTFSLKMGNSKFSFKDNLPELRFAIDKISMNSIKVAEMPKASLSNPCDWSSKWEVGGAASNVEIAVRFDPRIDLDECRLYDLGLIDVRVNIGGLNLKPLPTILDRLAKDIFESAIRRTLDLLLPDLIKSEFSGLPYILANLCIDKLVLYKLYMEYLSAGVTMHNLHQKYVSMLSKFYPNVHLDTVKFGISRQPWGGAITDCDRIYFKDQGHFTAQEYVDHLKNGNLNFTDFYIDIHGQQVYYLTTLYHELQHVEQCKEVGGRDAYAWMWFRDLEWSIILNIWNEIKQGVTGKGKGASALNLHDLMPMEEDANSREDPVFNAVNNTRIQVVVRDHSGNLLSNVNITSTSEPNSQSKLSGLTDNYGQFTSLPVLPGSYMITAAKVGYSPASIPVSVSVGSTTTDEIILN